MNKSLEKTIAGAACVGVFAGFVASANAASTKQHFAQPVKPPAKTQAVGKKVSKTALSGAVGNQTKKIAPGTKLGGLANLIVFAQNS